MTLPEVLLWRALRRKGAGLRFRRQHPIGPYVLDFYCASLTLAVEVDGIAHSMGNRPERDARRDRWLRSQGVRIMRIAAEEVLTNADGVVLGIKALADDSPLRPSGPLPPVGED